MTGWNPSAKGKALDSSHREKVIGYLYTSSAYLLWGVLGLYWSALDSVSSMEILAHRILWGFFFIFTLMLFQSTKRAAFFTLLKELRVNAKQLFYFFVASLAISANWLIFVWAMLFDHILEASLGLYITPIVTMLLGVLGAGDKIRKSTLLSMLIAFSGVLVITYDYGRIPWISMALALTSGVYSLAKKHIKADALVGMCVETLLVTPIALLLFMFLHENSSVHFGSAFPVTFLLIFGGILTVLPLLWFAEGLKRIPLATIGFFQYITPTITFLFGIFLFESTISLLHWIAFSLIWFSIAVMLVSNRKLM